jgi:MFS transporter, FHS family, glucose/mannose:H+ symporter
MTATSLCISDRSGGQRAANLERLNFAWSAGAMTAPLLLIHFVDARRLRPLYFGFQSLFVLMVLWILLREQNDHVPRSAKEERGTATAHSASASMVVLVLLAMFAVGVESALSGWLTTYSHRANPHAQTGGALATSLFWSGILVSRLVSSTRLLAVLGRSRLLRATLFGVAAAAVLLIAARHELSIDAVAALGGISIGPVYPLLLSYLLERSPRGWIFAVAGLGSALFPWMTGALSQYFGSLRMGLIAPCAAAVAMILLQWASPAREPATEPASS